MDASQNAKSVVPLRGILFHRAGTECDARRTVIQGEVPLDPERAGAAVRLTPVRTALGTGAMLFVPESRDGTPVQVNGARVHIGAHLIAHGDRIDLGDTAIWFSAAAKPERLAYTEARDGADRFCARTKARLVVGEEIVACPGTSQQPCSELYRALAWRDDLPCYACGFDPKAPEFEPPENNARSTRVRLLELCRLGASGMQAAAPGGEHA